MASRLRAIVALFALATLGCGSIGNSDVLYTLSGERASSSAGEDVRGSGTGGGGEPVVYCSEPCAEHYHCEGGTCVPGEAVCETPCDSNLCLTCDRDRDPPACRSRCDADRCEVCGLDARCMSGCDFDFEHCVDGGCESLLPDACRGADDRGLLRDNTEWVVTTGYLCVMVACDLDPQCTTRCIRAGDGENQIEGTGLSLRCSACFSRFSLCVATSCGDLCDEYPESSNCMDCVGARCIPSLCDCAGVGSVDLCP